MAIPDQLDGAQVICYTALDDRHAPTGATRHTVDGQPISDFAGLAICQYPDTEREFYLFYCDCDWNVVTDTCHQSLDDAKSHATFEFYGVGDTWKSV